MLLHQSYYNPPIITDIVYIFYILNNFSYDLFLNSIFSTRFKSLLTILARGPNLDE